MNTGKNKINNKYHEDLSFGVDNSIPTKPIGHNSTNQKDSSKKIDFMVKYSFSAIVSFYFLLFIYEYWINNKDNHNFIEAIAEVIGMFFNLSPLVIPPLFIMTLIRYKCRKKPKTAFFINSFISLFPIYFFMQLAFTFSHGRTSSDVINLFLQLFSLVIGTLLLCEIPQKRIQNIETEKSVSLSIKNIPLYICFLITQLTILSFLIHLF
ncbi:hypothetical protein [Pelistega ratti]|uniref:hypothetical protein n=1 Tax=Pelistega ratti TaxID=2652177 RepID=UPI001359D511|nr:hypothetical protein [Pelistega ratti]